MENNSRLTCKASNSPFKFMQGAMLSMVLLLTGYLYCNYVEARHRRTLLRHRCLKRSTLTRRRSRYAARVRTLLSTVLMKKSCLIKTRC